MRAARTLHASSVALLCLLALGIAAGCGDEPPERKLEEAAKTLRETRGEVEQARQQVEEQRQAVAEAERALSERQERLRAAEERLASASSRVESRATDAAIFRRVQSRLLEEDDLDDYAIAARVSNGTVTLSGSVKKEGERERALEIARNVPGVVEVQDQIQVEAAQPEAR